MLGPVPRERFTLSARWSRVAGGIAASGLAVVAAFHALWLFTPWPLANWTDFAEVVVGVGPEQLPTRPMILGVVGLVGVATYLVAARAGLVARLGPRWVVRVGAWAVAAMLSLRGVGGLVASAFGLLGAPRAFTRMDLLLYSPLCLLLGGLTALLAMAAPWDPPPP